MERTSATIGAFARRRQNLVDRCSKDVNRTQHAYKVYNVANVRKPYPSTTPKQKKQEISKKKMTSAPTLAHLSITDPLKLGFDFQDNFVITASSSIDSIVSEITIPVDIRGSPYEEKRSNLIKKLEYSVNTNAVNDKKEQSRKNLKRDDQNKENTSHRQVLKAVRQQYRDQVFDRLASDANKVAFRRQLALALNQS